MIYNRTANDYQVFPILITWSQSGGLSLHNFVPHYLLHMLKRWFHWSYDGLTRDTRMYKPVRITRGSYTGFQPYRVVAVGHPGKPSGGKETLSQVGMWHCMYR